MSNKKEISDNGKRRKHTNTMENREKKTEYLLTRKALHEKKTLHESWALLGEQKLQKNKKKVTALWSITTKNTD